MIALLNFAGKQARFVLPAGAFFGLAFPDAASWLRPAFPVFLAMLYTVAMLRIDLGPILRDLASPRLALKSAGLVFAFLVVSPMAAALAARGLGAGPEIEKMLFFTFAAPPIASASAFALMVGFSGRVTLELTIFCSLAMPFAAAFTAPLIISEAIEISALTLALRSGAIIFGGFLAAMVLRRWLGRAWVEAQAAPLNGVSALLFLLFLAPVFDGAGPLIMERPGLALFCLALSSIVILGPVMLALRLPGGRARNGALSLVWGTRAVAIFLAALPPDPAFSLYVAIYQFPMAAVVLMFGAAGDKPPPASLTPR